MVLPTRVRVTLLTLTLTLPFVLLPFGVTAQSIRWRAAMPRDGIIQPLLQRQVMQIVSRHHRLLATQTAYPDVPIELSSSRDVSPQIRAVGGTVEADIKSRVTAAMVPANRINQLAGVPGIRELYPSTRAHLDLDRSVPEIGANQVWGMQDASGLPIRGRHVLIGVLDSGIDYHNADFKNPDGITRIKYIWDQTQDGHAPAGYTFGYECDSASINSGACPEKDTDSHGTHVTGIAAGNGDSSSPAREIGVAPEADIIVVKTTLDTDKIIAGWKYLVDKARQLGEPIVINNSFGAQFGPHDGSEPDSQAIDQLSGPGRVFVAAAGNDGHQGVHTDGNVPQGGSANIDFSARGGTDDLGFELFYPSQDALTATLTNSETGETFGPVPEGQKIVAQASTDGKTQVTVDGSPDDATHNSVYVELDRSQSSQPVTGQWRLTVTGQSVHDAGHFEAWMSQGDGGLEAFSNPDEADTISDPADAHRVISVGNYATRLTWTGSDNHTYSVCDYYLCDNGVLALGDIKQSSSLGPTADGRQKPDIAAPGTMIESSLSADATVCTSDTQDNCIDPALITPDHRNLVETGTSMSAPHVAGTVALMLQVDPSLSPEQVDSILRSTARHDQFTGSAAWGPAFGAGKLNALAAVQAVAAIVQATPTAAATPTSPAGPTATPAPVSTVAPAATRTPVASAPVQLFSIVSLRVGSKPAILGATPRFHTGQAVSLSLATRYSRLPPQEQVRITWQLKLHRRVAFARTQRLDSREVANTVDVESVRFVPRHPGVYSAVCSVSIGGHTQQSKARFTVISRSRG